MKSVRNKNSLLSAIALSWFLALVVACAQNGESNLLSSSSADKAKCVVPRLIQKPDGDEIILAVRHMGTNRFEISVENVSKRSIFLPYVPESEGPAFVANLVEKLTPEGNFDELPSNIHFVPGLNGLDPNQKMSFEFTESESGTYRIVLRYLVDRHLVRILNDPDCFGTTTNDRARIQAAYGRVISPGITIE